jgi:DNA-binding LacI/PurR family transcriptional regulator
MRPSRVSAQALGYRLNALARTILSGRSRLVGLVLVYLDNQFYPIAMKGLPRRLQGHGYNMLLSMTELGRP